MKIVFAGSPSFAVAPLEALIESGKEVIAVITQPDRPFGRKGVLTPTPVKACALSRGIKVYDFAKIRDHAEELKELGADIMITCAYGQILTRAVLDIFPRGVYNLHASLLPLFRGASPIQSAILAGEKFTGVTVMKTEEALDSGDILMVKRCETGDMTCGELSEKLSALSAQAAVEAVELLESGQNQLILQDEARATYCKKISKENCRIDFKEPAGNIVRAIKAFSPQPAAFCLLDGVVLNILNATACDGVGQAGEVIKADKDGVIIACGAGAIRAEKLQLAGGKILSARDFANGRKIKAGDILD